MQFLPISKLTMGSWYWVIIKLHNFPNLLRAPKSLRITFPFLIPIYVEYHPSPYKHVPPCNNPRGVRWQRPTYAVFFTFTTGTKPALTAPMSPAANNPPCVQTKIWGRPINDPWCKLSETVSKESDSNKNYTFFIPFAGWGPMWKKRCDPKQDACVLSG